MIIMNRGLSDSELVKLILQNQGIKASGAAKQGDCGNCSDCGKCANCVKCGICADCSEKTG